MQKKKKDLIEVIGNRCKENARVKWLSKGAFVYALNISVMWTSAHR